MMNGSKKHFLFAVISALSFWIAPMAAQAVGISPVLFELKGLLSGSSVQRRIFITRSNPAEDENAIVTVIGDAAPYIRLPNKGEVALPKGVYNTPYDFFVEPGNLAKGDYEAKLDVAQVDHSDIKSQRMLTGAEATIRFSVITEAVEEMPASGTAIGETEKGMMSWYAPFLGALAILLVGYVLSRRRHHRQ